MRFRIIGLLSLIFALAPHAALAASKNAPPFTPDAVTHHTIVLGGKPLAYTARAGTITIRDTDEHPLARVFYTAFTADSAGADHRAVTFLYNGGPGASTIWLRLGSFGPVRVVTSDATPTAPPPYRLVDNADTLLDKTDLVFIDMPGSGFGRLVGAGSPEKLWGVEEDANAFAQFITRYLTQFHRWNSPKFLFGESYGTTRSAVIANFLTQRGVALNGIVLLSSYLNPLVDETYGEPIGGGDWYYVLYLPTEAATAWYHHAVTGYRSLDEFLHEVENFALGDYLVALGQGAHLPPDRFNEIVTKLQRYTGLSVQYIRTSNLRIPYERFQSELERERGIALGRLDSRFASYVLDKPQLSPAWDPQSAAIDGAFVSAGNMYMRDILRYDTPLPYRYEIYDLIGDKWDYNHGADPQTFNVAPDLARTMTYNPRLKVFSANGYFDFATPFFETEYVLHHLYLAPALQRNITFKNYASGHMVYLHPAALAAFHDDLERWYASILGNR